ncbi:MAG: hypothetical protein H0U52_00130 [Chloroflexi bacterium]|nr:hypothetical protein [Chloroflexota bacterium]
MRLARCRVGRTIGFGVAFAVAVVLAGCANTVPPSPASSSTIVPSASTSPSATPAAQSPPRTVSVAPTGVDPDPGLLELVPVAEAGAVLTYDALTTASVAGEPSLARDVSYLAVGLARLRDAPADDPNLAIVNVVRLRDPGSAGDEQWFRDWRDTYDGAACAPAGGIARHAETEVDGLAVFIAACANDAFTYHVRVADGVAVLSLTSVGPADIGRRIVEKLRQ